MRRQLASRGFTAVTDVGEGSGLALEYDIVLCLDVLDRVDDPDALLSFLRSRVKRKTSGEEGGLVVLAVVLPFCPAVESVGKHMLPPRKPLLAMRGASCKDYATFEESLGRLATSVLPAAGFEVVSFTKLPYLCNGDMYQDYFSL